MAKVAKTKNAKRGILFTVSVLLLSISLLSFAITLSQHSAKSRDIVISMLEIDRTGDTYSNLEDQLVRILSGSMNMSVRNDTVLLNASLPASSQTAADIESFTQFEYNYTEQNLSMNLTNLKNLSFAIQPNGVAITQSQQYFSITPQYAPGSSGAVRAYDINLTFPAAAVDAAAWQVLSEAGGEGSIPVHIRVQDASYAVNLDFHANIDKYATSLLNITQGGIMVGSVQFSSPAAVQVWHAGNIGLKASVGLTNPVYVEAADVISVSSYANRTGKVRIA